MRSGDGKEAERRKTKIWVDDDLQDWIFPRRSSLKCWQIFLMRPHDRQCLNPTEFEFQSSYSFPPQWNWYWHQTNRTLQNESNVWKKWMHILHLYLHAFEANMYVHLGSKEFSSLPFMNCRNIWRFPSLSVPIWAGVKCRWLGCTKHALSLLANDF